MILFKQSDRLNSYIKKQKAAGKSIGFVPTMGALHAGHYSLINYSLQENDITLCSIFVNPTQFNELEDLHNYPRTLDEDLEGLRKAGCPVAFIPDVAQIYPEGGEQKMVIDLDGLDTLMEGAHRPGHFAGVVQVVHRLLIITNADRLYMGQKDYQQFTIIQHMIDKLKLEVALVVCPILRNDDGLAMSSRNRRLLPKHREKASLIFRVLEQAKEWLYMGRSPIEISKKAMEYLDIPGFRPEYFDIIDGHTLTRVRQPSNHNLIVACTAVWAGEVRLIDNMILKGELNKKGI